MFSQVLQRVHSSYCDESLISSHSILCLSENAGFQLNKAEISYKSKTVSYQFVEFSSTSNFIRFAYPLLSFTCPHLSRDYLEFVREWKCVNHKRGYGCKMLLRLVKNFTQFMVVTHMLNKTLLSKPMFKEEIFCNFLAQ